MNRGHIKTGQLELAICLGAPLLVIVVIAVAGFVSTRGQNRLLEARKTRLETIPVIEKQVSQASLVIQPFLLVDGGGDKASELTLAISEVAQRFGFAVRSSSIEKQPGPELGGWIDFRVSLSGDGTLAAVIGMVDSLEQSKHHFVVAQANFRATQVDPDVRGSCDLVLVSRALQDKIPIKGTAATPVTATQLQAQGSHLESMSASLREWMGKKPVPLSTRHVEARKPVAIVEAVKSERHVQVSFRLTGVVVDGSRSVVMTDRGVFGIGDEIDGMKIEAISNDEVVVSSKSGRRERLSLY